MLRFWKPITIGFAIVILCLLPSAKLQKLDILEIRYTDLVVHLLMFLVFSAMLFRDLKKYSAGADRLLSPIVMALIISLLLGITTEMLQFFIASLNRTANLIDLLFDSAGTISGVLLMRFTKHKPGSGS
jgi:VanZ family protein